MASTRYAVKYINSRSNAEYTWEIYVDEKLVGTYGHDFRGEGRGFSFVDGTYLNFDDGEGPPIFERSADGENQLTDEAIAILESKLLGASPETVLQGGEVERVIDEMRRHYEALGFTPNQAQRMVNDLLQSLAHQEPLQRIASLEATRNALLEHSKKVR